MTERILLLELMKQKKESVSPPEKTVEAVPQPVESDEAKEHSAQEKREKEREQWLKLAQLRHRMGMDQLPSPNGEVFEPEEKEKKVEAVEKKVVSSEEREVLEFALKRLSTDLEELSSTLSRNKFPKVRFESGKLEEITFSLNRIRLPEDKRDMMELEPRNYRAVLDAMEKVEGDLLKLRGIIEEKGAEEKLTELIQVTGAVKNLRSKKELFQSAVGALRRYKDR